MKVSVKKDTHNGTQPVRVLKHNLTHRLVERNEALIKQLHSDFRLAKNITYHIAELPLVDRQTPFIDENGIINIHETYLSYIWAISFSMFVIYEEEIAIPDQIKRGIPTHKENNPELVDIAKELFSYAKSLVVVYSDWDKENLPNPEFFDEETEEGWYILRNNDLYVEVINFILCHEIAHAELEHINRKKNNILDEQQLKQLELEADTRAVNLMLENCRNRKVTELALIIGLASMLFSRNSLDGGKEHPDIDKRIDNVINILSPDAEHSIWPLLVLFVKLWDEQFSFNFTHGTHYNNYKDFYYELIKQA
ncbi:phage exclusion protein Lit family protein [Cyclobacterium qasimii]|uniref:Uncharacterized protein n=2 Tax=Cyclobacterium qasimii TaxID=1350429 RepID=S7WR92_9BACT|nr:phage exclusion protein Lit family protein [Cyclobacterium qasimii]EPR69219.1 hypothetical protein ADICYQ_1719 [Cyclobacterium qasimii M12-11B]GEO20988.1 hypothetical protein CQA01_15220 [Cyclobacterium qasimii]